MTSVRIGALFPATFNLNADVANASVLARRLTVSGVDAEVVLLDDPSALGGIALDALVIGSPSSSALADPALPRTNMAKFVTSLLDDSVPVLAVSNGFHLLGTMTGRDGQPIPGLDVIPVHTEFGRRQHVTIGARVDTGEFTIIGVENHNAHVSLDSTEDRFGKMTRGVGNDSNGDEGFRRGSLIGTHLHGPVFALNPEFADSFCDQILARRGAAFDRGANLSELNRLATAAAAHLERQATA